MSDELLKIHGNCQKYKFDQSQPAIMGCCMDEEGYQLPLHPLAPSCDNYKEIET